MKKDSGATIIIVILIFAMISMLIIAGNKLTMIDQDASASFNDYETAKQYANFALLSAESAVYQFDLQAGLETMETPGTTSQTGSGVPIYKIRYNILANTQNIVTNGALCNNNGAKKGFCYKPLAESMHFAENLSFQPWLIKDTAAVVPCVSYTTNGSVLAIDDGNNKFTILFNSYNNKLCAQPRYMIEPISLDYRGDADGNIVQTNSASMSGFTTTAPSARIYRITVRAFGYNGNARVLLQEYLAISNNSLVANAIMPLSVAFMY